MKFLKDMRYILGSTIALRSNFSMLFDKKIFIDGNSNNIENFPRTLLK